jgi:two-component system NtrC family sensor kinase
MSATPDSTLAKPEQLIADLQRQLAECKTERDEGLRREAAIAEVFQVINSSPADLAPVFDAMLEKAMHLCNAAFGGLFLREGEQFRAVATRGLPDRLVDVVRQASTSTLSPSSPLLRGEAIDHIVDATKEPLHSPGRRAAVELFHALTPHNANGCGLCGIRI